MVEKILIEMSGKDLKEVLCKHYGLDEKNTHLDIRKIEGDRPWESAYTHIRITGIKK